MNWPVWRLSCPCDELDESVGLVWFAAGMGVETANLTDLHELVVAASGAGNGNGLMVPGILGGFTLSGLLSLSAFIVALALPTRR